VARTASIATAAAALTAALAALVVPALTGGQQTRRARAPQARSVMTALFSGAGRVRGIVGGGLGTGAARRGAPVRGFASLHGLEPGKTYVVAVTTTRCSLPIDEQPQDGLTVFDFEVTADAGGNAFRVVRRRLIEPARLARTTRI
jgi:hypothetical protein